VLQNYIDVGAEDCGSLIALGNTFANLAGPITTALGVYLRRRTGGWMALLYASLAVYMPCGRTRAGSGIHLVSCVDLCVDLCVDRYVMASWQFFASFANWRFCGITRPDRSD